MVSIVCDLCGKHINSDFVRLVSDFMTLKKGNVAGEMIELCAEGDEIIMCDKCYSVLVEKVINDE